MQHRLKTKVSGVFACQTCFTALSSRQPTVPICSEKATRENFKGWSVSTTPGSPSRRVTAGQHPGKCLLLLGDRCFHRRLLEPYLSRVETFHKLYNCHPTCLQLEMHIEDVQLEMDKKNHNAVSHKPSCASLGSASQAKRL